MIIVGFGAFGELVARILADHADIAINDPSPKAQDKARALDIAVVDVSAVARADLIVLAVPASGLEDCLTGLSAFLRSGQVMIDTCSIKEEPVRLMRAILPETVEIVATHPMFGPQTARNGISGLQMVICPVRGQKWRPLAHFLRSVLGLQVLVTTPEEHDRQAAVTQGLTHLLAHALGNFEHSPKIRTRSFELLMEAVAMVSSDAPEVFEAIVRGNRYVPEVRRILLNALEGSNKTT
ncbi:prephenate dehydrogenase [Paracoccus saliphilus]|nr:prephenate dehydrogenase [Paracoccus saliphilus]